VAAHLRSIAKNKQNVKVFRDAGLPLEEAECCVYALSFYTGNDSNTVSAASAVGARRGDGGSSDLRRGNVQPEPEGLKEFLDQFSLIVHYLVVALRNLPYYWGSVVRHVTIPEKILKKHYVPGNIVTWIQYSSATRQKKRRRALRPAKLQV